jgi:Type IV secretory system Conjugative DNA transfer
MSRRQQPGTPLGRIVPGRRLACCGPEDVSVHVWGTRSGKTSSQVIPAILSAPGPVLATSNKRDVSDVTMAQRARRGTTWLFDPQGLASDGMPAFTYNPLGSVTDAAAAQRLAAIFEASTREPGARTDAQWDTAGRDLLAWLFLAAASCGLPIGEVWEWLSNPDDAAPALLLRQARHTGPATAVEGVLGQPECAGPAGAATTRQPAGQLRWPRPGAHRRRDHPAGPDRGHVGEAGPLAALSYRVARRCVKER